MSNQVMMMASKNERKSGGKIQVEQLQAIRKEWFGGRCMFEKNGIQCECTIQLQLAHAVPTELSIKKKCARSSYERLKDVMEYPERFILLCTTHHFEFDGKNAIIWSDSFYGRTKP